MGWTYSNVITEKAAMVNNRTSSWSSQREIDGEQVQVSGVCLAHSVRGKCLWTVWEVKKVFLASNKPPVIHRFIGLDLLSKDGTYGYKDMEESVHPYYYDCPLKYLDMVPEVASQEWRDGVRAYHAKKNAKAKIAVGDTVKLVNTTIPSVVIVEKRGRQLIGSYAGRIYRVPPRMIGEVIKGAENGRE